MYVTSWFNHIILYFNRLWVLAFAIESFLSLVSSHSTANIQLLKHENSDIRFQKFKKSTSRIWLSNHQFELLNQLYSDIHFHVIVVSFHFSIFDTCDERASNSTSEINIWSVTKTNILILSHRMLESRFVLTHSNDLIFYICFYRFSCICFSLRNSRVVMY